MPKDSALCSHVSTKDELYLDWAVLLLSIRAQGLLFVLGQLAKYLRLAKKSL